MISKSTAVQFPIKDFNIIKYKVLNWSKRFDTFCFLDNHHYRIPPHSQECLLAAGVKSSINLKGNNTLQQLAGYTSLNKGKWLFGHINYDLKNELEKLKPSHPDHIGFPLVFFFEPEILVRLSEKELIIEAGDPRGIFEEIKNASESITGHPAKLGIRNRLTREQYIEVIRKLQEHILRGDCYEINFCQEFYAEDASIDPYLVYRKLSDISPNPFSAFYRVEDKWLLCASPERFLKKDGNKIFAQPIKGTSGRVYNDSVLDEKSKSELYHSAKDRSENVMIVDLMRNDLSKVCEEGSVAVDELYGIYSFPQVHQMISTVSGVLKPLADFAGIIKACFPMGSMTGAPKKRVMELIDQYETTARGIFSGTLGYISPSGNFDFNVIIRSIMYNATGNYLSFLTGSGITYYSDPQKEWEECMLKAEAMNQCFT